MATAIPAKEGKYDKYFDGALHVLKLGVDCPSDIRSAQNAVRIIAKRKNLKFTLQQSKPNNCLYFQAVLPPPIKRRKKHK